MYITKKNIIFNGAIFILFIFVSIITFIVVKDFLHIFLVWNVFLALIPYALTILIDKKIVKKKIGIIITLLLWLFFFPNSMYIITDLIYINSEEFMAGIGSYDVFLYLQNTPSYLGLFHIYLGGILGLLYGFKSLSVLYQYGKDMKCSKYRDIIVIIIFGLSSFAIYVGRFFRYNSWDIFRVFSIIKDFFESLSWFTVFFILSYTLLLTIIFYSFKYNFLQKNKSE